MSWVSNKENLFYKQNLDEGFFGDLVSKVVSSFNKLKTVFLSKLKSLGFGKSVSLKINMSKEITESQDPMDLKSRLGYYSEFCCAAELSRLFDKSKLRTTGENTKSFVTHRDSYKKNKLLCSDCVFKGANPKVVQEEALRMEQTGVSLAQSIFDDVLESAEDLELLEFEIVLSGEEGKGRTKADIELFIRKKSTKEVIDYIEASLKAYKGWQINVSNSTFSSWIINLLAPEIGGFSEKGSLSSKLDKFVSLYGMEREIKKIHDYQSGENSPAKLKRKIGREAAKKLVDDEGVYIKVRDLMIKVFEQQYKSRKEEINANFLKLLGFDGADDLYIGVQKKAGAPVEVLSSRKSENFKSLMDKLQKDFNIEFEKSNKKVNTSVSFKHKKEVLFTSNFAFRDLDKVSQFVSFKNFR